MKIWIVTFEMRGEERGIDKDSFGAIYHFTKKKLKYSRFQLVDQQLNNYFLGGHEGELCHEIISNATYSIENTILLY